MNQGKKICLYFLTIIFLLFSKKACIAQGQWVWMKGSNGSNQVGIYGIKTVASAANTPGARTESTAWTDLYGNFWMFGGGTTGGYMNDLWKYDPQTNMWTWMKGSSAPGQSGIYGLQGTPSAGNTPGARAHGGITWVDNNGFLWLFGGYNGAVYFNDLWKYDPNPLSPTYNQWTWVSGSSASNQLGVYGVKTVAAPGNVPGARAETNSSWVDNNGNLWLFGGYNFMIGLFNDLWKYDIVANQWAWMSGDNIPNQSSVYGLKGIASPANKPGARDVHMSWQDKNGNFWIFGGGNFGAGIVNNDLWKYDPHPLSPTYNQWTWVSGSNFSNSPGVYGSQCITTATNVPSARMESRAKWVDDCGNFWMLGYYNTLTSFRNDLWKYNPITNEWTWMSGANFDNQLGVYGLPTVPNSLNVPGARGGAISWKNKDGLWLFGGQGWNGAQLVFNDVWKYFSKPAAAFTTYSITGCEPSTAEFVNTSTSNCGEIKSYQWDFGDIVSGSANTSTISNPSHQYATLGNYTVTLIVFDCTGSSDTTTQKINYPAPLIALTSNSSICKGDSILLSAAGGNLYSWNTGAATTSLLVYPTSTTVYSLTVTNSLGCSKDTSVTIIVNAVPVAEAGPNDTICRGETGLLNASGGNYFLWNTSATTAQLAASPLFTTNYTVNISNGNCYAIDTAKIIVNINPTVSVGSDVTILSGDSVILNGNEEGKYFWNPAQGLSCTSCQFPVASPDSTTIYCLTLTDQNNCTDMACITVTVDLKCGDVYTPTAFSPNEDGKNDLYVLSSNCIKTMVFTIYDRWGEKVFETNDINSKWDGKYKGKELNTEIFTYYMSATFITGEKITRKGNISLVK